MSKRFLALFAALLVVSSCGGSNATSGPKQGDKLTIAIGVDPDTLDPMRQSTTTIQNIVAMVVETLYWVDADGKIKPLLATSSQTASDGLSWTFTLRTGVKFTDGTPFNAAVVKANFDRVLTPGNLCALCGAFRNVQSIDAVDDTHVKLNLKSPIAPLTGLLTLVTFGFLAPSTIVKGTDSYKDQEKPVGTGPYLYTDRVKGTSVTLTRNDQYWGAKPSYKQQVFKIIPEPASREALIRSGGADVILLPPASDLPALQKDSSLKVILAPGDRVVFLAFNLSSRGNPMLQKPEVRRALNYAVNKEQIVKSVLFGAASPMDAPMAPSLFGYCKTGPYPYDVNKAKQMLADAGVTNLSIKFIAPNGRYIQDFQAAQAVANDLTAAGVRVDGPGNKGDWPTYLGTINVPPADSSVDLHLLGWAPSFLDAAQAMTQFQSSQWPKSGLATSYYKNPEVDALLAKAVSESDPVARQKEYCDASKLIWNDAPWIFLWVQRFPVVTTTKVTGVQTIPTESFYTVYASPA
ncbi:MAG: glutathione ABC transporter substrate-binding protein [Candidatus Dormibacteraceae bacterium]